MGSATAIAAVSNVGRVRSNNQDSGYAGTYLFVVADGMGGHAGGDVASALAVERISETDQRYESVADAELALQAALVAANVVLTKTVVDHPELTGMGTTVSALLRVGNHVVLAHIGDSRIYRLRNADLVQVTTDHTFVQKLVESGRITPEEALTHPRRSVLMRVLGDVNSSPEIDTVVVDTVPGDRWLLCSDGLSGVISTERIRNELTRPFPVQAVANRLIQITLDGGAPDNVTVIVADPGDDTTVGTPLVVGSAAAPVAFEAPDARSHAIRLPTLRSHTMRAASTIPSHFEPESEDYLDELIEEDRRRARRRRMVWLAGIVVVIGAIVALIFAGYSWTQSRYFVGTDGKTVIVFQGVQQDLGPIKLSHVARDTMIPLANLSPFAQKQVTQTLSSESFGSAIEIVNRLTDVSSR